MTFSNEEIDYLRREIKKRLSEHRYLHTLGVARAAIKLSLFCLPEFASELEVAALLHDITKEYSVSEQLEIIEKEGIDIEREDLNTPAVLHSFTAPSAIKRDFEKFATERVLSAVCFHTMGSPLMSVFDEIIFLADYIEETRSYPSSVSVRDYVYKNMQPGLIDQNLKILHKACIMAIDFTAKHLEENKKSVNSKNILTRNALLSKI